MTLRWLALVFLCAACARTPTYTGTMHGQDRTFTSLEECQRVYGGCVEPPETPRDGRMHPAVLGVLCGVAIGLNAVDLATGGVYTNTPGNCQ